MDYERGHADRRQNRPHVQFQQKRAAGGRTVRGLADRRSCRAHVARISSFHGMSGLIACWNSPVPHMATMAAEISSRWARFSRRSASGMAYPSSTTSAAVRDGCVAANSAAVANAPSTRRGPLRAPEIVEHRGDAVGPLLQGRHRARLHRIGSSTARLVEKDEPTERCHRLNPPLNGRQLRQVFAAREPVRDEHDVALPSAEAR